MLFLYKKKNYGRVVCVGDCCVLCLCLILNTPMNVTVSATRTLMVGGNGPSYLYAYIVREVLDRFHNSLRQTTPLVSLSGTRLLSLLSLL